jgi:hypothetical protein
MTIQLRVAVCSTELVFSNLPQNSVTPQYAYYVGIYVLLRACGFFFNRKRDFPAYYMHKCGI